MADHPRKLATVSSIPKRRPGRPTKLLATAVEATGPGARRQMLVILRRKAAKALDAPDGTTSPSAMDRIMRTLLQLDGEIREIDDAAQAQAEAEAEAAARQDDEGVDETFDPDNF